jgi:hypothetical protein
MYISNASVKLPRLPTDVKDLKEARKTVTKIYKNPDNITGYDFFVDVDCSDPKYSPKATAYAKRIRHHLRSKGYGKKQPIKIYNTSNGIHLVLKGRFTPDFCRNTVVDFCCKQGIPMNEPFKKIGGVMHVCENGNWRAKKDLEDEEKKELVKKLDSLKLFVDTSIYDLRRIRRVPFSLHSKTGKPMRKI